MRTHGNAALDQKAHRLGEPRAAFDLHHLRAGLHDGHGALISLLLRAIGAERQVGQYECLVDTARDAFGVITDVAQRDGQRRALALDHVAERVANQNGVDPHAVEQRRETCVIRGEHGDLLAPLAHLGKPGNGHGLAVGFLQITHVSLGS